MAAPPFTMPGGMQIAKAVAMFLVVTVVAPLVTAGTALAAMFYLPFPAPELPDPKPSVESRVTHVFDSTGAEIGVFRRFDTSIPVEQKDIPEILKQAVVAAEDKRFYSHGGFDLFSAMRAAWADFRGKTVVQGGSTITQQYIKKVYTGEERTLARKIREAVLAGQLDRKVTKDEILYRYLNTIYFGGGAYGIGAAAESYFHKPVNELTLSESALLAGLISAPSDFDPRANPERAESNRRDVLDEMLEQKRIDQGQYAEARAQELFLVGSDGKAVEGEAAPPTNATLVQPLELQSSTQPYFVDYVRRYLVAKYGDDLIYRGGLKVETTLDPRLQALAETSVADALDGTDPPLEMAMVSVEPTTGYVKALVGGRDFNASQVNLALGACPEDYEVPAEGPVCLAGGGTGRQPGSAFKPFTLAKAFEEGIGPSRVYSGPGSYTVPNCTGTDCTVGNVESGSYGSITLREATIHSVNTVYAQLIGDVGVPETAEMAHRLGITMVAAGRYPGQRRPLRDQPHPGRGRGVTPRHGRRLLRLRQPGQPAPGHPHPQDHRRQGPGDRGQHQAHAQAGAVGGGVRQRHRRPQGGRHQRHRHRRRHRPARRHRGQDRQRRREPRRLVRRLHSRPLHVGVDGLQRHQYPVPLQHQGRVQGVRRHHPRVDVEGLHGRGPRGRAQGRLPQGGPAGGRRHRRRPPGSRRHHPQGRGATGGGSAPGDALPQPHHHRARPHLHPPAALRHHHRAEADDVDLA